MAPEATTKQTGPRVAWNANYTKVSHASAVFDIKYSGYDGYYAREPYNGRDLMGWYDDRHRLLFGQQLLLAAQRSDRQQVNATVTKFASGFAGQHSLKFGAEFERSRAKNEVGYPGGGYIVASYGVPYYAYLGGDYLQDATNNRMSLFVQDSWAIGRRLTITPGLRFDMYRGSLAVFDEDIYKATAWGPRIGFAYDMFASGRTVIRGHYGRYFDGAKANYYNLVNGTEPLFGAYIDPVSLQPLRRTVSSNPGSSIATVSDDLKQPTARSVHRRLRARAVSELRGWGERDIPRQPRLHRGRAGRSLTSLLFPLPIPGPTAPSAPRTTRARTLTFYNQRTDPADDRFLSPTRARRSGSIADWS